MILYSLNPSQLFERHSVFLFFPRSCFCFIWLYTIDDHTLENFGPEWHSKSAPKLKTPLEITPPQKNHTPKITSSTATEELFCWVFDTSQFPAFQAGPCWFLRECAWKGSLSNTGWKQQSKNKKLQATPYISQIRYAWGLKRLFPLPKAERSLLSPSCAFKTG